MLNVFINFHSNWVGHTGININSETKNIVYGVPQGSVLGPLLFLIYVNDISNIDPKLKIKLFADDTNIFLYNKNIYTLINDANKAMHDVNIWLKQTSLV